MTSSPASPSKDRHSTAWPARAPTWARPDALAVLTLLLVTLLTHGWSLGDGLFFDDYWHRATLRDYGWTFSDLIESATFDLPGPLAHLWWQEQPLQWRYARAVAMLFMKIEYHLSGGSPVGVHAFAIFWHFLTGVLVYRLALRPARHRAWAAVAAIAFLAFPHSVFAVSWTAARNALVSGMLFAAAVLCYVRSKELSPRGALPRASRAAFTILSIALGSAALLARETAIILPPIFLALDLSAHGWRGTLRRWPLHLLVGALVLGYLYWRLVLFPIAGTPEIYYTAPHGPGYALWAAGKLLHMLFAHLVYTPMFLGLATYSGVSAADLVAYGVMLAAVSVIGLFYVRFSSGAAGRWVWPLWTVLAFVPVIPVFVMPHFSYLAAIASSIAVAIVLSRIGRAWRGLLTAFVLASTLWSLALYRVAWRGIVRCEQLLYADIAAHTDPPPPGTKLFFLNLPVAGIYATVAMRERWGLPDLEGYVLTFAPHPLIASNATGVEVLGERELVLSAPPPGFFSGMSGRMLIDGMRPGHPLRKGDQVSGDEFDTTVLEADAAGVTRLLFRFREPLASPHYRFFLCTVQRPAQPLVFMSGSTTPLAPPVSDTFSRVHAAWFVERQRYFALLDWIGRFVKSDLLLTGDSAQTPDR